MVIRLALARMRLAYMAPECRPHPKDLIAKLARIRMRVRSIDATSALVIGTRHLSMLRLALVWRADGGARCLH